MQNVTSIKSRIIKQEDIHWRDMQFIQDDDFKEWVEAGEEKLLQSILAFQFIDPFKVWLHKKKLYCLDGKHRYRDLIKAAENGIDVPEMLPATFIDCTDMEEAAKLVLVYSSYYARISQMGFYNHIEKFKLPVNSLQGIISLPSLDISSMKDWFLPEPPAEELIGLAKKNALTLKITFKTKDQVEAAEPLIKTLLAEHCPGAFYSVGGGEL